MEFARELAKEFASATSYRDRNPKRETTTYGVVKKNGDDSYVQLDGTDILTPISFTMEAEHNDRVLVMLKEHSAVVIGNVTSPASARTANSYMKLTPEGLIVGKIGNDGNPYGTYTLICGDGYYIMSENSETLAYFSTNKIVLGKENEGGVFEPDKISLGGGAAEFTTDKVSLKDGKVEITADSLTFHDNNGASIFNAEGISLLGGKATFKSKEINLLNGQVKITVDPNEISLGQGKVVLTENALTFNDDSGASIFNAEGISLLGGKATFKSKEINLLNGQVRITVDPNEISLGNQKVVLTPDSLIFNNDSGSSIFNAGGVSLLGGKVVITSSSLTFNDSNGATIFNADGVSLLGGKATFKAKEINLLNGQVRITVDPNAISFNNGEASFGEDAISLKKGKVVITADSLTFHDDNGDSVFNAQGVSLFGGKAQIVSDYILLGGNTDLPSIFSAISLSLAGGQMTINKDSITIGGNSEKPSFFTQSGITLRGGEATFTSDQISLQNGTATFTTNGITLLKGNGRIQMADDVLVIQGTTAVGFKNTFESGDSLFRSEIICRNDRTMPARIGIQTLNQNNNGSSIILDQAMGIQFTTPTKDGIISVNGEELLQTNRLYVAAQVMFTGTLKASSYISVKYKVTSDLPAGYRLVGIRQVSTNRPNYCVISRFITDPTTEEIQVTVKNLSETEFKDLLIRVEWFALRYNPSVNSIPDTYLNWDNDESIIGDS